MIYPWAIKSVICTAHLFYGDICFVDMFILWCCLLQLSGRPTAHNKHYFSPRGKTFFYFSLFFLNKSPRALKAALLPLGLSAVFICSSTSLWFLWSLFLLRICLCPTGPRAFKMMKGSAKCLGRRSFICMMCLWLFPFVISSQQPDREMRGEC